MRRLTDWVLTHRVLVVLAWVAVAVAGGAMAPTTVDRLSYEFALPDQPAYETNVDDRGAVRRRWRPTDPLVVVVRGADAARDAEALARAAEKAVAGTRTVTAADPGAESLTAEGGDVSVGAALPAGDARPRALRRGPAGDRGHRRRRRGAGGSTPSSPGFLLLSEGGAEGDRGVMVGGAARRGRRAGRARAGVRLAAGRPAAARGGGLDPRAPTSRCWRSPASPTCPSSCSTWWPSSGWASPSTTRCWSSPAGARSAAGGRDNDDAVRVAMSTAGSRCCSAASRSRCRWPPSCSCRCPFLRSIGLGGLLIPLLSVATSLTLVPVLLSARRATAAVAAPRRRPTGARGSGRPSRRGVVRRRWLTIVGSRPCCWRSPLRCSP